MKIFTLKAVKAASFSISKITACNKIFLADQLTFPQVHNFSIHFSGDENMPPNLFLGRPPLYIYDII
jgi:hypothetical protein